MFRREGVLERWAWWDWNRNRGGASRTERRTNHCYSVSILAAARFLTGAGRLENPTTWAPLQPLVGQQPDRTTPYPLTATTGGDPRPRESAWDSTRRGPQWSYRIVTRHGESRLQSNRTTQTVTDNVQKLQQPITYHHDQHQAQGPAQHKTNAAHFRRVGVWNERRGGIGRKRRRSVKN